MKIVPASREKRQHQSTPALEDGFLCDACSTSKEKTHSTEQTGFYFRFDAIGTALNHLFEVSINTRMKYLAYAVGGPPLEGRPTAVGCPISGRAGPAPEKVRTAHG